MNSEEEYASLKPEYLALYLARRGWKRMQHDYFNAQQWINLKAGVDLLLPQLIDAPDYERFIKELVTTVAKVEGREIDDVVRDLLLSGVDVVRLKRETNDASSSIPVDAGRALLESGLRMMTAAAAATVDRRAILPSRRPRQASEYIDRRVRLGQSERGSYVMTILSDITPLNTPGGMPGLLEFMDAPFPRKVVLTLQSALQTSHEYATAISRGETDAVEPAVQAGISAEFLDSLSGLLAGATTDEGLTLHISWAPALPEHKKGPVEFRLEQSDREVFAEASRRIREMQPLEGIPITGVVEGLHRDEGAPDGVATIACIIEQGPRKLHVALEQDAYEAAIEAHQTKKFVVFRADVEKRGRRFIGLNVKKFRISDE